MPIKQIRLNLSFSKCDIIHLVIYTVINLGPFEQQRLTKIRRWVGYYICSFIFGMLLLTHALTWVAVAVMTWMSNYSPLLDVELITYPCFKLALRLV